MTRLDQRRAERCDKRRVKRDAPGCDERHDQRRDERADDSCVTRDATRVGNARRQARRDT